MLNYTISFTSPSSQYIDIKLEFTSSLTIHEIQLPSWRPGRYELGNFAKNIKGFNVFSKNKAIPFSKITKDRWKIQCELNQIITIEYKYYASELNAGSTYLSSEQLYINPVNCCIYIDGLENLPFTLHLNIPDNFIIACGLKQDKKILSGNSFDELADSPLICSPTLQHNNYHSNGTKFNIWFQGAIQPNWNKIINDFQRFTDIQIEKFGDFPVSEYHFLIQISPYRTYHGVEHKTSTVIHLGPTFDIFGDVYSDLLGVSSHELYHTWNVKSIRPIEMFPYDFTKENYSELGYLCEGVTTYMGDLMLLKSGVFSLNEYFKEMENQLQKHFDNDGRKNYSVAASSFDTWLDGYVIGAPGRKTSIYTEGCLISFILDVLIIKNTQGEHSLDNVMKYLYDEYYKKNKGVSVHDYKSTLELFAKQDLTEFWSKYITGRQDFKNILEESFHTININLCEKESSTTQSDLIGFKTIFNGNNHVIKTILEGSTAEQIGLMLEDELIAINSFEIKNDLEKWLTYYSENEFNLLIKRKSRYFDIKFKTNGLKSFKKYKLSVNSSENLLFKKWIS